MARKTGRAYRRERLRARKRKAIRAYDNHPRSFIHAHTWVVCSCWLCGNQRFWHGPTFQERRDLQTEE